jgi:DNA mismatch endonuclease (patch repair protein)
MEVEVRKRLHALGLRFRVDYAVVPRRKADLAFTKARVAIFLDGCFWHGCAEHRSTPQHNRTWWSAKLRANRQRDVDTTKRYEALGWLVLRFWEHDGSNAVCDKVVSLLRTRTTNPVD